MKILPTIAGSRLAFLCSARVLSFRVFRRFPEVRISSRSVSVFRVQLHLSSSLSSEREGDADPEGSDSGFGGCGLGVDLKVISIYRHSIMGRRRHTTLRHGDQA